MLNIEIRDTTTNWLCLVDSEIFSSMRKRHCWLHLWNEQMEISQDIKKNKATKFLKTSTALQAMDGWKVEARRLDFYPTTIDWCCVPWKDVPTDKYQRTTIELKRMSKESVKSEITSGKEFQSLKSRRKWKRKFFNLSVEMSEVGIEHVKSGWLACESE